MVKTGYLENLAFGMLVIPIIKIVIIFLSIAFKLTVELLGLTIFITHQIFSYYYKNECMSVCVSF